MADIRRTGFHLHLYYAGGGAPPDPRHMIDAVRDIYGTHLKLENIKSFEGKTTLTLFPNDTFISSFQKQYSKHTQEAFALYFEGLFLSIFPQFRKPAGVLAFQNLSVTLNRDDSDNLPSGEFLKLFQIFAGMYMIFTEAYEVTDDSIVAVGELTPYAVRQFADNKVRGWGDACRHLESSLKSIFTSFTVDALFNEKLEHVNQYMGEISVQVVESR